ncbi:hypothetical protein SCOCK_50208 [Actinacidiphila cocklensis]|uniref:Uncharacterized protein n=1 Tax=Actinacidiphila cocklensis TaxID=887465 RepID=A0A9W4E0C6_9ACTN|nr:hypothetical protein SCOCK_50208 [Actinacidiphila cocklensis]
MLDSGVRHEQDSALFKAPRRTARL